MRCAPATSTPLSALFEKAAELDPELAPAHAALSRLYLDRKENEKALASAETALTSIRT